MEEMTGVGKACGGRELYLPASCTYAHPRDTTVTRCSETRPLHSRLVLSQFGHVVVWVCEKRLGGMCARYLHVQRGLHATAVTLAHLQSRGRPPQHPVDVAYSTAVGGRLWLHLLGGGRSQTLR
jgi:hypothetical protein